MKIDILAIGAHPDDVELSCAATLAKEMNRGKKVGILDLTRGELGTRGTAEIRDEEAKRAAKILGVEFRHNIKLEDGFIQNNKESQLKIIEILRKYKPDIVLCNAISDRHPDHGKAAKLTSDACFLSGLRRIETTFEGEKQEAWRPKHVYHYIQWENLDPDFVVDVTGFIDKKMESVFAYRSQFYDPNSDEPVTAISTETFKESINYRARELGRLIDVDYAEGYTVQRQIAVDSLFDLI